MASSKSEDEVPSRHTNEAKTPPNEVVLRNSAGTQELVIKDVTKFMCLRYARQHYPSTAMVEAPNQGRGTFTVLLPGRNLVLQFRPPAYRLDLDIIDDARRIFGDLVPDSRFLAVIGKPVEGENPATALRTRTMVVYAHSPIIRGVPFSTLKLQQLYPPLSPSTTTTNSTSAPTHPATLTPLIHALVHRYYLPSYRAALAPPSPALPARKRNMGWTLRRRLGLLCARLPERFRSVLAAVAAAMDEIEGGLCWGLTHGDFLVGGGNVVVGFVDCRGGRVAAAAGGEDGGADGDGGTEGAGWGSDGEMGCGGGRVEVRLKGLVDWYVPVLVFGLVVCLYPYTPFLAVAMAWPGQRHYSRTIPSTPRPDRVKPC
jgi:hypothetical protein